MPETKDRTIFDAMGAIMGILLHFCHEKKRGCVQNAASFLTYARCCFGIATSFYKGRFPSTAICFACRMPCSWEDYTPNEVVFFFSDKFSKLYTVCTECICHGQSLVHVHLFTTDFRKRSIRSFSESASLRSKCTSN